MADELDQMQERQESFMTAKLKRIQKLANIPEGEPGVCKYCDEESKRLVNGFCAACRDEWGLS